MVFEANGEEETKQRERYAIFMCGKIDQNISREDQVYCQGEKMVLNVVVR